MKEEVREIQAWRVEEGSDFMCTFFFLVHTFQLIILFSC